MATKNSTALTQRPAWQALELHYQTIHHVPLRQLFAADPQRGERFAIDDVGMYLDYSKHRITDETRGRVMSIYMLTWGFTPIGAIAIGEIASRYGIAETIAAAAILGNILLLAQYVFYPATRKI